MSWQEQAACIGAGHLFFGRKSEHSSTANRRVMQAQAICSGCSVRAECREAGRYETWGVWGGRDIEGRGIPVDMRSPDPATVPARRRDHIQQAPRADDDAAADDLAALLAAALQRIADIRRAS